LTATIKQVKKQKKWYVSKFSNYWFQSALSEATDFINKGGFLPGEFHIVAVKPENLDIQVAVVYYA